MELIESQAVCRDAIESRSGNRTAKGAARAKTNIVEEYKNDVGGILRGQRNLWSRWFGLINQTTQ
jgi:hypothetical protein